MPTEARRTFGAMMQLAARQALAVRQGTPAKG